MLDLDSAMRQIGVFYGRTTKICKATGRYDRDVFMCTEIHNHERNICLKRSKEFNKRTSKNL